MGFVAFTIVCGALGTGSEATLSSEPAEVTGGPAGPASAEGLQSSQSDDDELEIDEEHSGGENENLSLHGTTRKASKSLLKEKLNLSSFISWKEFKNFFWGFLFSKTYPLWNSCCLENTCETLIHILFYQEEQEKGFPPEYSLL